MPEQQNRLFVGETILETKWPSGYGRMTAISPNRLSRTVGQ